jgi:hypothetical protein
MSCVGLPAEVAALRLVLITEALEAGAWPKDYASRLKGVEINGFYGMYSREDVELMSSASEYESAKASPVKKIGKKRNLSGDSVASSASKLSKSSKKKKSKKAKDNPEPKDKSDPWRSGVNDTLLAMQQSIDLLTSALKVTPSHTVQSSGEDLPVDVEQFRNVREFIENIPTDETQRKGVDSGADEPPPVPPRPTKYARSGKTATGQNGDPAFQFSRTMAQEEGEILYSDHDLEHEPSEGDREDDQPVEMDLGRLERRKMYLKSLGDVVPHLIHPEAAAPGGSQRFPHLAPKVKENVMPFIPELFDRVGVVSIPRDKKPRDPFKSYEEWYPTSEPAESGFLQVRDVPRELLDKVPLDKQATPGASGRTATLKASTVEGVKEAAALKAFKQSAGYIRLANNIEIGIEMLNTFSERISSNVKVTQNKALPPSLKHQLLQSLQASRLMGNALFDLRSTNADLLKGALFQHQSALFERRLAWLDASTVPKGTASELKAADFPKPLKTDPPKRLHMFGPDGKAVLEEYHAEVQERRRATPMYQQSSGSSQGRQQRSRGPPQHRQQGYNAGGYNQYPANPCNFQGPPQQGRGRGRGRANRGANSNRPMRRPGRQPFSAGPQSQKKE